MGVAKARGVNKIMQNAMETGARAAAEQEEVRRQPNALAEERGTTQSEAEKSAQTSALLVEKIHRPNTVDAERNVIQLVDAKGQTKAVDEDGDKKTTRNEVEKTVQVVFQLEDARCQVETIK